MGEVKSVKMDTWTTTESPNTLFADGERVLCFHGPLIYEAKVLKTKPEATPVEYYIHYAGWSKNWDEWVPELRVLKYNDENVKRQKELARVYGERSKKDNKKGSAKAKKMDESRASTPSKDANTSLSGTNAVGAGGTSSGSSTGTPVAASSIAAAAASTKYDSSASSGTTASSSTTATAVSRGNRKSIQSATTVTTRPTTPSSAAGGADKKDEGAAAENTEDELPVPAPPKSKRSEQQRASSTGNGSDASTASTTMTNQQEKQPPATATATTATSATTTTTTSATTATAGTTVSNAAATPAAVPTDAPSVESEEVYTAKLEVKIKIPDELKHYLTDDWYAVVREHKLLELPAKVTVQQIADQYLVYKKSVKSTNASKEVAINDVLDGIIEYFNVMLGSQLLYKFERTQYADIMQKYPDTPLSELYGSFHLLRLFVRLGSMLSYSALDQPAMQTLLAHLHDFLKFLVKNSAMYFSMTNFINVDPEYVRNAQ